MNIAKLYYTAPKAIQNALCSIKGFLIKRERFDKRFGSQLEKYENRSFISHDAVKKFQTLRLEQIIKYCYENLPFYQKSLFQCEVYDGVKVNLVNFSNMQILNKTVVRENIEKLKPSTFSKKELLTSKTSGTTGAGLIFPTTRDADKEKWAVWWRYRRWHGMDLNCWSGHFGGQVIVSSHTLTPPFWRYNLPGKQILFSVYHLNKISAKSYVDEINKRQLTWLHGYPSFLAVLAGYIIDLNLKIHHHVQWVTTGAENLMPYQKELITKAFGVTPIEHYGMAESVANFSQCPNGKLHVDEDYSYVEFLPTKISNYYKIIGTNFTNKAFPLIRYDTGDIAKINGSPCNCGRPGRVVDEIDGRCDDYVVASDGTKIGRLPAFKDMVNVQQAQIHQTRVGEITLKLVVNESFNKNDESNLVSELNKMLKDIKIDISYVDKIEKTKNGKLRLVVSELK